MDDRYQRILDEFNKLTQKLAEAKDPEALKALGKKQAEMAPLAGRIDVLKKLETDIASNKALVASGDADIAKLAEEEIVKQKGQARELVSEIDDMLIPKDPHDSLDAIVEIRAAAGGNESSLFAAELFRMYQKYAESKGWRIILLSTSRSDISGYKEVVFEIAGVNVYANMKFESGVHRVQRVPETEKSGRVHTSTVTVAVLPKVEKEEFSLDAKDLKIEASTSRGAGGQSVNTTYSAIKATHIPTGITAQSQDERSQQQNKDKALTVLAARVFSYFEEKKQRELSAQRLNQIGSGDRSEKIRTYNFPQDRITDHRINQSFKQALLVLEGKLDPIIEALKAEEKKRLVNS